MKAKINKTKLLGQVFSGSLVAKIIAHFIPPKPGLSVIDPMCGIGDLLMPYLDECKVQGIEIDTDLKLHLQLRGLHDYVVFANSFDSQSLDALSSSSYDIVVTNPPYIRKENLQNSGSSQLSLEQMKINLISFSAKNKNLNSFQKNEVIKTINCLSGLSDIAALAWLLCMTIVKDEGFLGIVVPNSWLTREYAKPIKRLLLSLFEIEAIINDVNNSWFKQRAQVKTNIVICKKRSSSGTLSNHTTRIYSLYSSFDYKNLDYLDTMELPGVEKYVVDASEYLNQGSASFSRNSLRLLIPTFDTLPSLEHFAIKVSQGLRSGANKFFYLKRNNSSYVKSVLYDRVLPLTDEFFLPLLHKQSDLNGGFSFSPTSLESYVLYIQDSITARDLLDTPPQNRSGYLSLPFEIEDYITASEDIEVNGTLIPQLSSVRTNVSKGKNKPHRFWYMLPTLQERHLAQVVMPRVNSESVIAYINPTSNPVVVDANFITFVAANNSTLNSFSLLAVLNSSFCRLQYEETGTPMGGGALKIDAVQIQRIKLPSLENSATLQRLTEIGTILSRSTRRDSSYLIDEVDTLLLKSISNDIDIPNTLNQIKVRMHQLSTNRI